MARDDSAVPEELRLAFAAVEGCDAVSAAARCPRPPGWAADALRAIAAYGSAETIRRVASVTVDGVGLRPDAGFLCDVARARGIDELVAAFGALRDAGVPPAWPSWSLRAWTRHDLERAVAALGGIGAAAAVGGGLYAEIGRTGCAGLMESLRPDPRDAHGFGASEVYQEMVAAAAGGGQSEFLRGLRARVPLGREELLLAAYRGEPASNAAAAAGSLPVLKVLRESGASFTENTSAVAAEGKHTICVLWLTYECRVNCPYSALVPLCGDTRVQELLTQRVQEADDEAVSTAIFEGAAWAYVAITRFQPELITDSVKASLIAYASDEIYAHATKSGVTFGPAVCQEATILASRRGETSVVDLIASRAGE